MTAQTIIHTNKASLYYHKDKNLIHHRFYSQLDSFHLRKILNQGVDLIHKHNSSKWLSDNREIGPHSEEDTLWINTDWLPRAIKAGWKYWALVVPDNFIARVNMQEFVDTFYNMGIRVMVFTEVDEAMSWIENVDQ